MLRITLMICRETRCRSLAVLLVSAFAILPMRTSWSAPNPKGDGFHGIWYYNQPTGDEYVYKYSGGLGLYPAKHAPFAVYAPAANKTFFCYGGTPTGVNTRLWHMVSCFDHATGRVARPTFLLDKATDDAHDNPVIAMDDTGVIWVFSTAHGLSRPSYVYRSTAPYDINEFEPVNATRLQDGTPVALDNFSYFQVRHVAGQGFVAFFTHYSDPVARTTFFMTSSDGVSWSEWVRLAAIHQGHYQVTDVTAAKAGTAFNYHPNSGGLNYRTDLYYMETPDNGQTWQSADGTVLTLPVTNPVNDALVIDYQAQGLKVYMKTLRYDSHARPVIIYLTSTGWQPGPQTPPRRLMMTRWTGTAWTTSEICETDHNYDSGELHMETNGVWRFLVPAAPGPQAFGTGGDLEEWRSSDLGATWTRGNVVTTNSLRNHTYVRRPLNARPDFYWLWADGNAFEPSASHLYCANQSGTVYRLPPSMTNDWETPSLWNVHNARGATHLSQRSAMLRGDITCPVPPSRVWVCWGRTDGGTDFEAWDDAVDIGMQAGGFEATVSNLTQNTGYFYRCYTTNAVGESWADETESFSTTGPLEVRDGGVTGVGVDRVEFNGDLEGGDAILVHCFWGETDGGTNVSAWAHTNALGTLARGAFTASIDAPAVDTRYYYRLRAAVTGETAWASATTEFRTLPLMFDPSAWFHTTTIAFPGYDRDETLTNFPALVRIGENMADSFYARCALPNGGDLRFSDADQAVRLPFEIETWNTNGHSEVWVRLPELRRGTHIHVYWGNPNAPPLAERGNARQTWDSTFSGVWHLGRTLDGELGLNDATTNGINCIDNGTADANGIIGGARQFTRSASPYLSVGDVRGDHFLPAVNTPISIACWARPTQIQTGSLQNRAVTIQRFEDAGSALSIGFGSSTRIEVTYAAADNTSQGVFALTTPATSNAWHYLVLTYGSQLRVYVNGQLDRVFGNSLARGGTATPLIGAYKLGDLRAMDGQIDDVRFARVERSSNWVWAAWANVVSNAAFVGYGAPVPTAYEGFEYEGAAIDGQDGGFGWGGAWTDTDGDFQKLSDDGQSLFSAAFPFKPRGGRMAGTGNGTTDFEALRPLAGSLDFSGEGRVVYFSCLMRKDATNMVFEKVELGLTDSAAIDGVAFGLGSSDTFYLRWIGEASLKVGRVEPETTYFLVGKIVASASGPDQAFLSAYGPGQSVDAVEPGYWTVTLTGSKDLVVGHLWAEFGRNVVGGQLDEIRLGRNWASVTVPPPAGVGTMIFVR